MSVKTMLIIRQFKEAEKTKRKKRGNRVNLVATPPLPVMSALMSPKSPPTLYKLWRGKGRKVIYYVVEMI